MTAFVNACQHITGVFRLYFIYSMSFFLKSFIELTVNNKRKELNFVLAQVRVEEGKFNEGQV